MKIDISTVARQCKTNLVESPVNILRAAQKTIVRGKLLEIESLDSTIEGATNQIMIDMMLLSKGEEESKGGNKW